MSTNHSLFKSRLRNALASFILFLGANSCSQCQTNPYDNERPGKEVIVQIVPLSGLALVGGDNTIECKLQQASNSAAVDLTKLQLTITVKSTPKDEVNEVAYLGNATKKLSGSQIGRDQAFKLDISPTGATTKLAITLQVIYNNQPLKGAGSSQIFTWEKMNDVTDQLFTAIQNNNKDKALELLTDPKNDIQVGARNGSGITLLHAAIQQANDIAVIDALLLVPKIDKNALTPAYGNSSSRYTPLELAISAIKENSNGNRLEIIEKLIEKGAQVRPDDNKTTILHAAIKLNKSQVIKDIVTKYPALINQKDKDGNTPLHIAANTGNYAGAVVFLLNNGANASLSNNDQKTPEQVARQKAAPTSNIVKAFEKSYTQSI